MALTRLKNVFTSKTGRCLYVNSDDFDASDAFDNRGNSPNRPFKSIQRALLEAARFSYKSGQFNDTATTEIYTRSLVGSVRCV